MTRTEEVFLVSVAFFLISCVLSFVVFPNLPPNLPSNTSPNLYAPPLTEIPSAPFEAPFSDLPATSTVTYPPSQTWAALLVAGSKKERVFDNAVKALAGQLRDRDVPSNKIKVLSAKTLNRNQRSTRFNINRDLGEIAHNATGCFIYVTSHGTKKGIIIATKSGGRAMLNPQELDTILDRHCGEKPTIVIISGCYSGIFAGRQMQAKNRIILTASRADRTSFGCTNTLKYTFFDDELLKLFPQAKTWQGLFSDLKSGIAVREIRQRVSRPSQPQASFGASVAASEFLQNTS